MEQYVGLDVSLKETRYCVVDADGVELARGREVTRPDLLAAVLARSAPSARVVVLETGGQSSWLQRGLEAAGVPAVIVDARRAKAALSCRLNKTDLSGVPPQARPAKKKAGPRGPGKSNREASRLGDVKRVRRPGAPGRRPKQDDVALQHRSVNRYKFLAEIPPVNSAVEPCMWCMPGWRVGNPCKSTRWGSAARAPAGFRGPGRGGQNFASATSRSRKSRKTAIRLEWRSSSG